MWILVILCNHFWRELQQINITVMMSSQSRLRNRHNKARRLKQRESNISESVNKLNGAFLQMTAVISALTCVIYTFNRSLNQSSHNRIRGSLVRKSARWTCIMTYWLVDYSMVPLFQFRRTRNNFLETQDKVLRTSYLELFSWLETLKICLKISLSI